MTRRRTAKKPEVRLLSWSSVDGLFPYGARMSLQPPAEVTVRLNAKSWTYTAVFTDEQAHRWTETVRIDPVRRTVLSHEITMKLSFRLEGRQ